MIQAKTPKPVSWDMGKDAQTGKLVSWVQRVKVIVCLIHQNSSNSQVPVRSLEKHKCATVTFWLSDFRMFPQSA